MTLSAISRRLARSSFLPPRPHASLGRAAASPAEVRSRSEAALLEHLAASMQPLQARWLEAKCFPDRLSTILACRHRLRSVVYEWNSAIVFANRAAAIKFQCDAAVAACVDAMSIFQMAEWLGSFPSACLRAHDTCEGTGDNIYPKRPVWTLGTRSRRSYRVEEVLRDGRACIDNSAAERAMRPIRKTELDVRRIQRRWRASGGDL